MSQAFSVGIQGCQALIARCVPVLEEPFGIRGHEDVVMLGLVDLEEEKEEDCRILPDKRPPPNKRPPPLFS